MTDLIKPKDVAKILACSLATVYKMALRGQLPCVRWDCPGQGKEKPRTMLRFEPSAIEAFIEKHRKDNDGN